MVFIKHLEKMLLNMEREVYNINLNIDEDERPLGTSLCLLFPLMVFMKTRFYDARFLCLPRISHFVNYSFMIVL